jgi:putative aldouronate transport system permease protein
MVGIKRGGNRIRVTRGDRIFHALNAVFLTIFFVSTLYPLMCLISSAISSPSAVYSGAVTFYPIGFSLRGFKLVFSNKNLVTGFLNSVFYTVVGTILNVTVTMLAGYVMSRKELRGRTFFSFFFAFTMWFSGGIIPFYLLIRDLGIFNTRWALLLPGLMSVFNMIVCRTFIASTIPVELYESVSIDGCGYFRYFTAIVVPVSSAIIAVLSLWYAIGHWNAYFNALILLYDKKLFPLQLFLRNLLVAESVSDFTATDLQNKDLLGLAELMKNSLIVAACLPLWLAYPFIQKYFVKGVMIGSIKG